MPKHRAVLHFVACGVFRGIVLGALCLAVAACGAPREGTASAQAAATDQETASPPLVITVPVTVEVTRLVVTERIVVATPEPPVACAPEQLSAVEEIVVGAILPLSQPASLTGALSVQTALSLAADEINAAGGVAGKPLRVWFADSGGETARARQLAEEAFVTQCAVALVGASSSEVAAAILEAAHHHGRPYIILEASDDGLTTSRRAEAFRLAPSNSMLAAMYGEWLAAVGDYNGDGALSALLLVEDSEGGLSQAEMIGAALASQGIQWDAYPVQLPSTDFSSLIARIVVKEVMPDAIFVRFNGESSVTLHRQLLENGVGPQKKSLIVRMRSALDAGPFWQELGAGGVSTVVGRVGPWPGAVNQRGAAFAASFERYLDRWPDLQGFTAYDSLWLLEDAIKRAGSLDPEELIAALEATDLTLAAGHYSFPHNGHVAAGPGTPPWTWHQWMDAPLLFLQYTAPLQGSSDMAVLWPPAYSTVEGAVVRPPAQ